MIPIIGFFKNFFDNFSSLYTFVTTPLKELVGGLDNIPVIGDASIMGLLGVGLIGFLGGVLVFHLIRLFIGG